MRKSLVAALAFILLASSQVVAAPGLLSIATGIERDLNKREPEWDLSSIRLSQDGGRGGAQLIWRRGGQYVRASLSMYDSAGKAEEELRGQINKATDRGARAVAIPALGDEAYTFESDNPGNPEFYLVTFRQGKVVVTVTAAEALARRFAGYISDSVTAA